MSEAETQEVVKKCPHRILRSRGVYRDKHCGVPPLAAKARVVVLGFINFNDPDLSTISRYSPVISRVGVAFVLQVFSSSHIKNAVGWLLVTADIATAFLQGVQHRREPLYMWSPRDPLVAGSGTFKSRMMEIQGNVYGLCNAPHTFSRKVIQQMCLAGFQQHPLDCMLFLYFGKGVLEAVAGFHVDDLLLACSPSFPMHLIKDSFEWGSWSECSATDATPATPAQLTFTGKQILVRCDGSVCVCMSSYIDTLPQCEIPSARSRSDLKLQSGKEMQLYRSAIGSLQWMAGSARPDLSAWCSLLQQPEPDVTNLRQVSECLEFARNSKERGTSFYPVSLKSCVLVLYADASYGNAAKSGSQCGMIVALTSLDCLKSADAFPASIIEYKSFRARRVCRSTLAAEAQALEAGVDHTQFVASYFTMGLTGVSLREAQGLPSIPFVCLTDCKSLYDSVLQTTPSLEERRVIITVAAIREAVQENSSHHPFIPARLFWIPTTEMCADALTKMAKPLRDFMSDWMCKPTVRLQSHDTVCGQQNLVGVTVLVRIACSLVSVAFRSTDLA
eukprot:1377170-Amphidinium_carterae.1